MSENTAAVDSPGGSTATTEPWRGAPDKRRAWSAVLSYPLYFLGMVLIAVLVSPLVGANPTETKEIAVGLTIPVLSAFLVIAAVRKVISPNRNRPLSDILLLRQPPLKTMIFAVGVGIACQILLAIIGAVIASLGADLHSSTTTERIGASQGTMGMLIVVLASSLAAPLAEELFFRGLIFNNLAKGLGGSRVSVVLAALLSSSAFAFMHMQGTSSATDFLVLGWTFVMGMIMCWLARRTETIWAPFVAHATYNGFIAVVLFT